VGEREEEVEKCNSCRDGEWMNRRKKQPGH